MPHVLLSARAERDLKRLLAVERQRVQRALRALSAGTANLDVKPLVGCEPWRRLRVGDWRILFRRTGEGAVRDGIQVARIVNRRDLDEAARSLRSM